MAWKILWNLELQSNPYDCPETAASKKSSRMLPEPDIQPGRHGAVSEIINNNQLLLIDDNQLLTINDN